MVFDVDDAIWLRRGGIAAKCIARASNHIVVGNQFLGDYFADFGAISVIPTAVDVLRYRPARVPPTLLRIGWCGTSSGFQYLALVEPAIRALLRKRKDVRFAVMADRPPTLDVPGDQLEFVPWTEERESKFLRELAIGIMPLADGPWERGKCSYKMLTYMASGVAAVVSPIGMNADLLREGEVGLAASSIDEWVQALEFLLDDAEARTRAGVCGRSLAEDRYSVDLISNRLSTTLRSIFS